MTMTTTDNPITTTRTIEQVAAWLTLYNTRLERDNYESTQHSWIIRNHSTVSVEQCEFDGINPQRHTSLYLSSAHGVRVQVLDSGGTAIVADVEQGTASVFLPFTIEQVLAALQAEQDRRTGQVADR